MGVLSEFRIGDKMVRMVLVSVLILAFYTGILGADAYYGFLEEPTSSRATAMGTAGSAVSGISGYSFYNPALPSLSKPSVALEFGKLYDDLNRGFLEFGYSFPKWFFALSLQSQSISFQYADERGLKIGSEGSEQGLMASIIAGITRQRFSAGLSVNGIHNRIADDYSNGVSISAGAIYQVIAEKLTVAAAVLHLYGRNTGFLDTNKYFHHDPLPMTARAGASWTDTVKGRIPYTVSTDVVYSFNYDKVMVPVGLEAWILPVLAVRLGKRINHETDLMSMGIGLKLANIKYDVAFTPLRHVSDLEMKWSMALTYELPSSGKKSQKTKFVADTVTKSSGTNGVSQKVADSLELKVDSIMVIDSGIDNEILIEKKDTSEDSTGAYIIELDTSSEKETSSDSIFVADTTLVPPVNTEGGNIIKVNINPEESIGKIKEEKDLERSATPEDADTSRNQ